MVAMVRSVSCVRTYGTGRQGDRREVDGVADVLAGEIDGQGLGDGVGRNRDLEGMVHDVEHATLLDARALFLIDEVDRDLRR